MGTQDGLNRGRPGSTHAHPNTAGLDQTIRWRSSRTCSAWPRRPSARPCAVDAWSPKPSTCAAATSGESASPVLRSMPRWTRPAVCPSRPTSTPRRRRRPRGRRPSLTAAWRSAPSKSRYEWRHEHHRGRQRARRCHTRREGWTDARFGRRFPRCESAEACDVGLALATGATIPMFGTRSTWTSRD